MEDFFEAWRTLNSIAESIFHDGSVEAVRIAQIVMRRLSIVTRLAIAWPFVLLIVTLVPNRKYWPTHYIVLTTTIIVFLAFLWMMTTPVPLSIFAAETMLSPKALAIGKFVEKARKATKTLRIVLGLELLLGVYFAWTPIANNRPLALTQIIILAAIVSFAGIKGWKPVVVILALAFCVITLVFFLRGKADSDSEFTSTHPLTINLNIDRRVEAKTDEQSQNPTPGMTTAATPLTRAQQSPAPIIPPTPDPNVVPPAQQVVEQACPALPQPIEYGEFLFVLTHCGIRGNQVRLSGNIQYDGPEKTNMYFHPFNAYDDAGNIYVVQDGRFGDSENFGLGHSGQWMYPPTSGPYSVPFSLELGPKNGGLPPAEAITLVMPCSDQLGGQIVLQLALR